MNDRSTQVKIRLPEFLKDITEKVAQERKQSLSNICAKMILKAVLIGDFKTLTETEKEYAKLKLIEYETDMLKFIRSKNAEKINFVKNIKKQIFNFNMNYEPSQRKDIIQNMNLNLQIAQANGWMEEESKIKQFIKNAKIDIRETTLEKPKRIEAKRK